MKQNFGLFGSDYDAFGLGGIPDRSDEDDARAMQLAQAGPYTANAYTGYSAASMAGRGLGTLIGAAAGKDVQTEEQKKRNALARVRAAVAGLDKSRVEEYYSAMAQAFRAEGMENEAARLEQMLAQRQDAATNRRANEARASLYEAQRDKALKPSVEEAMLDKIDAFEAKLAEQGEFQNPADVAALRNLQAAYERRFGRAQSAGPKAPAGYRFAPDGTLEIIPGGPAESRDLAQRERLDALRDRLDLQREKEDFRRDQAEGKAAAGQRAATQAYRGAVASMQEQYDRAVALHNHAGVPGITGRYGSLVGEDGQLGAAATRAASAPTRAALALHEQIMGATFLEGLSRLKNASKTGATGLGAVSEREGAMVQAATAALNRKQDAADYRRQLATYAASIDGAVQRLAEAAEEDGMAPIYLRRARLNGQVSNGPAAPAAPARRPAAGNGRSTGGNSSNGRPRIKFEDLK
jgi:hypothetical protein